MSRPDLSSDEAIAAYKAEMRAVGRKQRFAGLACVVLGAIMVWSVGQAGAAGPALQMAGYGLLAVGWVLMLAAIFLRTRYHRRRMAELD
ncbi:hypothetical protein [Brevundimonas sp.]|uniref:hypothetical protein n=1 Tax=Brevundimonas sp. TaxID=1871086 RepID=UPI002487ED98|nr:hypothetical protein [Brevundimonas sp.]MDI1280609.1 hypothetical protein [Brevundimonas sp.]